jgi:hypothetical protein
VQLTFEILMVHPAFSPEVMFRSHHESNDEPNDPFLLLGEASAGDSWLGVQRGGIDGREGDYNPDVLASQLIFRPGQGGRRLTRDRLRALDMRVVKSLRPLYA